MLSGDESSQSTALIRILEYKWIPYVNIYHGREECPFARSRSLTPIQRRTRVQSCRNGPRSQPTHPFLCRGYRLREFVIPHAWDHPRVCDAVTHPTLSENIMTQYRSLTAATGRLEGRSRGRRLLRPASVPTKSGNSSASIDLRSRPALPADRRRPTVDIY